MRFMRSTETEAFERKTVARPNLAALSRAAQVARGGDSAALTEIATAFSHAAFCDPFAIRPVYDAFTAGWLGDAADTASFASVGDTTVEPSDAFWSAWWQHFADRHSGRIPASDVTARVAQLGGSLPAELAVPSEAAARTHPKSANAHLRALPPKLTLAELKASPEGSLARDFYALVVANGFDLEVLDRSGLELLPPALAYLNARILQMHDVWHLIGGFRFTVLHEIAISTFQLSQFNHGYSAMLLAASLTELTQMGHEAAGPILQTIAEAWRHGCATPSFMAIAWEKEWNLSIEALRERHGIAAFKGSLPSDLFERALAA
jgi:ubiquinone biosynthesis protein Coq4